ncbi:hypothetical protein M8J77_013979 [Diaphorina citri]|nr:hypothetical protein M8J77_013979 [Diaphorina citri]
MKLITSCRDFNDQFSIISLVPGIIGITCYQAQMEYISPIILFFEDEGIAWLQVLNEYPPEDSKYLEDILVSASLHLLHWQL